MPEILDLILNMILDEPEIPKEKGSYGELITICTQMRTNQGFIFYFK